MKTSKLLGITLIGTLLLSSCYQPDVVMHTTITDDSWWPCERKITYSNVMPQKMRDSLWAKEGVKWSQPLPECINTDAFMGSHTDIGEGDTVSTTFSMPFKSTEEMSQQTPLQLNGTHLRSKASLKKQFRSSAKPSIAWATHSIWPTRFMPTKPSSATGSRANPTL